MSGERRFVFSARVIGAVHRDSPKLRVRKTSCDLLDVYVLMFV